MILIDDLNHDLNRLI